MTRLVDLEKKWLKDPAFVKAYDDLEEEFSVIFAVMEARAKAGLSQAQLARKMKTTQSAIARLESGKAHPSTRTLWKLAAATGTKLKISFEPIAKRGRS
jgi:ribosome-binding protein aMBF1 (putative translation factor)